jgi:YegS/Rv2252/BmrU family lipid kinase
MPRTLLIVNPASRAGRTQRAFAGLERELREALGAHEREWTRAPRDAVRIAREAAHAGYERVLVGGGDGTASEVATGLVESGRAAEVALGFLPLGTGGDLLRTLGIPRGIGGALDVIRADARRQIDAGRLDYTDLSGARAETCFVNETSVGLAGLVASLVDAHKPLGATGSFLVATLRGLARFRAHGARVRVDGELVHEGATVLATASNGRYFGGGMFVAPHAELADGAFDVVVIPGLPKPELLARLPMLYRGTHVSVAGVLERRGRRVEIEALEAPHRFECDGEALGTLPLVAELLPRALHVIAPKPQ